MLATFMLGLVVACCTGETDPPRANNNSSIKSSVAPAKDVTAQQLLQRLDLTSFNNSTGPNRGGGRKYPGDWGFTELTSSADWASLENLDAWDMSLKIIRWTRDGVIVCFIDDSQTATYSTQSTLLLVNDGFAGFTAVNMPEPDPTCPPLPGQG